MTFTKIVKVDRHASPRSLSVATDVERTTVVYS
jgi:hypothetical protein